jgi:hypothetical protein
MAHQAHQRPVVKRTVIEVTEGRCEEIARVILHLSDLAALAEDHVDETVAGGLLPSTQRSVNSGADRW